ncbi:MAG: ATP-grasp domain-containing protein [Betaproteobacteria bacterium]|nr:ATP-grasp domain-containing protein [Betaproteobacteria bacterium]
MSDESRAMPPDGRRTLLVVSTSARMLVRAARRAGWRAWAVDAFGDIDTRVAAQAWQGAALAADGGLDGDAVLRAVGRLAPREGMCLVVGSGLEGCPQVLRELARRHRLAGNAPQVWEQLAHAPWWFALLRELRIPHPEVAWGAAPRHGHWLVKRAGASGGLHVRGLAPGQELPDPRCYAQRRVDGPACSLLFLADGRQLRVIGFNRMLPAARGAPGPFAFSGASAPMGLAPALRAQVIDAAQRLVGRLGLRGLCGLDFMLEGGCWLALELNARPTATVELWDLGGMPPLLDWHLRACDGELPQGPAHAGGAHALAVAYAGRGLRVPPDMRWPGWCHDLPHAGRFIEAGAPLCTVRARHVAPARAAALAAARAASLQRGLEAASAAARAMDPAATSTEVCA